MGTLQIIGSIAALVPALCMGSAAVWTTVSPGKTDQIWRRFKLLAVIALIFAGLSENLGPTPSLLPDYLQISPVGMLMALVVQFLAVVIGGFSATYLDGEKDQPKFVTALAAVLGAVHILLMAGHWLVLVTAWVAVGIAMHPMLCFYPDRPFARLAAHKKQIADRLADLLLIGAACLCWTEVGSGTFSAIPAHIAQHGMSMPLQIGAVALVAAVILRSAQFPIHGWLIQVMEAPTPVSALLHAGVVNLGGFVLILLSPLLEHADAARLLLLSAGLTTAILAGLVTLTRISIKVKLAWSTMAQIGFMLVECASGLYTMAALHLVGHSLYKAHAFLSASSILRQARLDDFRQPSPPAGYSLVCAPALAIGVVIALTTLFGHARWPWWWNALSGVAWAPLLWTPEFNGRQLLNRLSLVAGLTVVLIALHRIPLGIADTPDDTLGVAALAGMAVLYLILAMLQIRPTSLSVLRRFCYAGFYVDEAYTRLTIQLWPADLMKRKFP